MTIYANTDGASRGNPGESGIGVILRDDAGTILYRGGGYIGASTNNIAEYQALIACLKKVKRMKCDRLVVHSDSELMVRQLLGKYRVKDPDLKKCYGDVVKLLNTLPCSFEIVHIERELNQDADMLANTGIDTKKRLV